MDEYPLPLDVARALVDQYRSSALDVARNRANAAQHGGDMKAHDHALLVLTEVEELVGNLDIAPRNPTFIDNDGSVVSDAEMRRRLDGAMAVDVTGGEDLLTGKVNWV